MLFDSFSDFMDNISYKLNYLYEDEEEDEEDGEWEEVDDDAEASDDAADEEADDIMAQLVELFKTENGREPTEEEVQQWMQTLKEAAEDGGLAL